MDDAWCLLGFGGVDKTSRFGPARHRLAHLRGRRVLGESIRRFDAATRGNRREAMGIYGSSYSLS